MSGCRLLSKLLKLGKVGLEEKTTTMFGGLPPSALTQWLPLGLLIPALPRVGDGVSVSSSRDLIVWNLGTSHY